MSEEVRVVEVVESEAVAVSDEEQALRAGQSSRLEDAVKTLMCYRGLTQGEISESVGFSKGGISSIISRKSGVGKVLALALEHVYGLSKEWILTGEGERFLSGFLRSPDRDTDPVFIRIENILSSIHFNMVSIGESLIDLKGVIRDVRDR